MDENPSASSWLRPTHRRAVAGALALLAGVGGACALEEAGDLEGELDADLGSKASAISLENGLEINGISGNGLYVNGIALNSAVPNGIALNGIALNGIALNGITVNGIALNGIGSNGLPTNGIALNGLYVNGLPLNGLPTNGIALNGIYRNGIALNGLFVNGVATNGIALNGIALNGLYVNGLPFNGLYVNGLYPNGLYVNGIALNGIALNGLRVNGTAAATAIKIASTSGALVNLSAAQESAFESVIGHLAWCALPSGQSLTIYSSAGVAKTYPGRHNLAPGWRTGPLASDAAAVDDNEELRWCVEHYRPVDSANKIYPGLALNPQQLLDLQILFKYLASCALPAGDSVTLNFPAGPVSFAGGLGLAPSWKTGALDVTGQKIVSACLAGRTNALGNTVRISLRGPSSYAGLATSAVERANFTTHEGAFWGNVFGAAPSLNACAVDGGGPSGRVCTDGNCGFTMSSTCSASCDFKDAAGNWTSCGAGDEGAVLNTFLMTADSLTGGDYAACARRQDGTIVCWGSNTSGALGDGTYVGRTTHAPVLGLPVPADAQQIVTDSEHACSRHRDGRLFCWGSNQRGELGLGNTTSKTTATEVTAVGNSVASVVIGDDGTCAVKMDGTLWCWGANPSYRLATTGKTVLVPTQVAALGNQVVAADMSMSSMCAVKVDGTLWCWGEDIGTGTYPYIQTPTRIQGFPAPVISVQLGRYHACALLADGTVWCWGSEYYLGTGSTNPLGVSDPRPVTALGNSVVRIDSNSVADNTCALKADGTLWCWGKNAFGEVGDGTTTHRYTPVQVPLPRAVRSVVLYGSTTMAILTDGSAWGWGQNYWGQIQDGSNAQTPIPTRSTMLRRLGNGVCDFTESALYEPAECPLTPLFSDDFAAGDVATLSPRWIESPTGAAGKWDIVGAVGGVAGYPYSTTGARTGHAAGCTTAGGCSITMASAVNLAGKRVATLAFLRFVHANLDAGEYLKVEVWNGTGWSLVKSFTDAAGDDSTWHAEEIDLIPYQNAALRVRFSTNADAADEHVHIEDVKIVAR